MAWARMHVQAGTCKPRLGLCLRVKVKVKAAAAEAGTYAQPWQAGRAGRAAAGCFQVRPGSAQSVHYWPAGGPLRGVVVVVEKIKKGVARTIKDSCQGRTEAQYL